jgi:hypothetical protein
MRAPIFIIGFPRSGTSFVGKLIAQCTGYPSHGESHTLTLLQEVHHQINIYRQRTDLTGRELVNQFDLEALKEINTIFFRDFYLRTYGTENFIDKTPGAVACHGWGVVKEVFPNASFVACVRSPVEVYESALQKFSSREGDAGRIDPIELAKGWVGAMNGIEKLAASSFAGDLLVVSQLELRVDPLAAVTKLFQFLGVPEEKIDQGVDTCRRSREDVLTNSIDTSSYKLLDKLNLSTSLSDHFRHICTATCSAWGIEL